MTGLYSKKSGPDMVDFQIPWSHDGAIASLCVFAGSTDHQGHQLW